MPAPSHNSQAWSDQQSNLAAAEIRMRRSSRHDLAALQEMTLERKEEEDKTVKQPPPANS